MTQDDRDELTFLKREVNPIKSDLMDILRKVEAISPSQAAKLERIIGNLEAWQNK